MGVFSAKVEEKINHYLGRYETKRSAILPVLHFIQDEYGYVKDEHVEELHQKFQLDRIDVREVLTFYSMYRQKPPKKFQILFCNNMVCHMMGADNVIDKIKGHVEKLQQKLGPDVPFSVEGVPCLGVCDGAPAMLVNKDRHLKVTLENVDSILQKYAPLQ
jgi:NADH-quinone oxidoreductase subunit E